MFSFSAAAIASASGFSTTSRYDIPPCFSSGLMRIALRHWPMLRPSSKWGVKAMSKPRSTAYLRHGLKSSVHRRMRSGVAGVHSGEPVCLGGGRVGIRLLLLLRVSASNCDHRRPGAAANPQDPATHPSA